jgi:LAO/AO transport system kinase
MMLDLTHNTLPKNILHHGQLMEITTAISGDSTQPEASWRPPICQTVATQGTGLEAVVEALEQHRAYQRASGHLARRERERLIFEMQQLLKERLLTQLLNQVSPTQLHQIIEQVVTRQIDPDAAVENLLNYSVSIIQYSKE